MASYRIYVLDRQERVARLVESELDSDAAAGRAAEVLRGDLWAAEVWRDGDLVARTGASFTPFESARSPGVREAGP